MKQRISAVFMLVIVLVSLKAYFSRDASTRGRPETGGTPLRGGTSNAARDGRQILPQDETGLRPAVHASDFHPPSPIRPDPVSSGVMAGFPMTRTTPKLAGPNPNKVPGIPAVPEIAEARGLAELEEVQMMLRDFRTRMGDNPVGSNAEIMQSVMGGNPAAARLGPPPGQTLNADGELLDPWGTPYFFHQLSAIRMEVRSAGPDKTMWSGDDLSGK